MKFLSSLALFTGLCLITAAGCFQPAKRPNQSKLAQWMAPNGKLKVLCTTSMVADLVEEVGKDLVDCLTLIQGENDPHTYQLVKGDDEKFARADLIFYNGLGLEHGPSLENHLKNSSKAYAVGEYIRQTRPQDIVTIDGNIDPHIWMDVSLWSEMVPYIVEVLSKSITQPVSRLEGHAQALSSQLMQLHTEMRGRLRSLPEKSRYLVTSHQAFNYFARAYLCPTEELSSDLWRQRAMSPEGLAPDSQLSTADIQKLVNHIIQFQITTLFAESNVSRDSLKKLVDACGKMGFEVHIAERPLYADAMGPAGSDAGSYMGMMRHNSQVVAQDLHQWMASKG